MDPQRMAILARIRAVWRQLGPWGHLLFFDVQPITVKAYGGRRYSSQTRLVLSKRQKTRGRFYLLLLYDARSGQIHWRYSPHKDSGAVCRFLRQVRRWYPDGPVWVVLDQDPAHPRRSRQTRRLMRQLTLHWISLPQGCPDDNPVEAIFSTVERQILQCSNDPDERATRQRINAHLRGHNRRKDRRIDVPYLWHIHKH
jgi:hypothetical protein